MKPKHLVGTMLAFVSATIGGSGLAQDAGAYQEVAAHVASVTGTTIVPCPAVHAFDAASNVAPACLLFDSRTPEDVRTILDTEIPANGMGSWANAWYQPRELALRTLLLPRNNPQSEHPYLLGIMPWGERHVLVIVGSAWDEEAR